MVGGRDQREPIERLVRILAALHASPARGVPTDELCRIAGFTGVAARDQLTRELRQLADQGWRFVTDSDDDQRAVYRLEAGDNRLALELSPAQGAALRRAALLVDRPHLAVALRLPPAEASALPEVTLQVDQELLATILSSMREQARLLFRYNGTSRCVHPQSLGPQNGHWYLRANEDGAEAVKQFRVTRMSYVDLDEPGTLVRRPIEERTDLHPMRWLLDEPVDVELLTPAEHAADVRRWLGEPTSSTEADLGAAGHDPWAGRPATRLRYRVTNRAAFRHRVYELGLRVRVVGPDSIRAEIAAELAALAAPPDPVAPARGSSR